MLQQHIDLVQYRTCFERKQLDLCFFFSTLILAKRTRKVINITFTKERRISENVINIYTNLVHTIEEIKITINKKPAAAMPPSTPEDKINYNSKGKLYRNAPIPNIILQY